MNVYEIIAQNNPQVAQQIIESFGYEIKDNRNLGKSLSELVAEVGEPALKKIMYYHPDREVILELFSDANDSQQEKKSCNCGGCKSSSLESSFKQPSMMFPQSMGFMNANGHYFNADGGAKDVHNTTLANQTNVILIVASLFVATALILKTQK